MEDTYEEATQIAIEVIELWLETAKDLDWKFPLLISPFSKAKKQ